MDIAPTLGNDAPSYTMVKKWFALLKGGRTSVEGDPRPATAMTEGSIAAIEKLVMENRRLMTRYIGEVLNIGHGAVEEILHTHLRQQKIFALWVPRLLKTSRPGCRCLRQIWSSCS